MTTEKMSVHRAMRERKMLEKKIEDAIQNLSFVTFTTKGADSVSGVKKDKKMEFMRSDYQQLNDWLAREQAIDIAIAQSNATATVVIAGMTYTVAQAIKMKNSIIEAKHCLLIKMIDQLNYAQRNIESNNRNLENRANDRLRAIFGNVTSANAQDAEAAKKAFVENETCVMVDPLNIEKVIKDLRNEIDAFSSEVDAVLSESNAVTMIEINY